MAVVDVEDDRIEALVDQASQASALLKAIGSEARLLILCHLSTGEKSVSELERLTSSRQSAISQQLSRLRREGIVTARREGKAIIYSISDDRAKRILDVVHDVFCGVEAASGPKR